MEKYKRLRVLGQGSLSKVFLVEDAETGEHVVVKQIEATLSDNHREQALREAALLRVLKHPFIVGYREAFVTRSFQICLIMEFAEGGDLHQFLQRQRSRGFAVPEAQVLGWFVQLCDALQYLHSNNVIHRDIKARNIFLRESGKVQLGDFGISTQACGEVSSTAGTPTYLSPERVLRLAYGPKADIWSLGVVVYELCALKRPFEAECLQVLSQLILSGEYAPLDERRFSAELRHEVGRMLAQDPGDRPSAAELLALPFMPTAQAERGTSKEDVETVLLADDLALPHDLPEERQPAAAAPVPPPAPVAPPEQPLPWEHSHGPTATAPWSSAGALQAAQTVPPSETNPVPEMEWPDEEGCGSTSAQESPSTPMTAWLPEERDAEAHRAGPRLGQALLHGARRLLGLAGTGDTAQVGQFHAPTS